MGDETPSTSSPMGLVPLNNSNQEVVPYHSGQVCLDNGRTAHQRSNQMLLADGDYRGANIGNTYTAHTYYNVQVIDKSTPKKRKIERASEIPGFIHLDGNIYINMNAPIAKHARVYEGEARNEILGPEKVAVKLLPINTAEDAAPMIKEACAIRDHTHPNVVRYISASFSTEKFMSMYLVMEMCKRVNLYDHVMEMRRNRRKFSFKDCMSVARQLSSALKHLHKRGILHRDIKPSNVLFSLDGHVLKITDFSLIKPLRPGRSVTADSAQRIGTDGWRAPEVYVRNNHGKKSDVYSLGLLLYYVWSNGEQAFGNDPELSNFHIKANRNRDLSKIAFENPEHARELLTNMLQFDEEDRISAEGVHSHFLCKEAEDELEIPDGEEFGPLTSGHEDDNRYVEGPCIVVCDKVTFMMHAYKPSSNVWGHMQILPEEVRGSSMTTVCAGEFMYVLLETKQVFRIKYKDPNATWETEPDMILEHGSLPPVVFTEGFVYVIGASQRSSEVSKKGECLDLATKTWSRIPDMQSSRAMHSIVACNDCIYSIGGRDDSIKGSVGHAEKAEARGEKYDLTVRKWRPIAPMHGARNGASATALNDKIYILGGWRLGVRLSEAECYDTTTDVWTVIKRMNIPRSFFRAVTVEEKVYVISGDTVAPMTIEEYNPNKDKWEVIYRMQNLNTWKGAAASIILPPFGR